jgi:hypothetical protein
MVCLYLVLRVLLTRILVMNLDVSSNRIHDAKTIHITRCEHTSSYYNSTYIKKQCRFEGISNARIL